jgi:prophage antirepressor-like protein
MSESDNFFLDVFNELLKLNDETTIIIFDIYDNMWFSLIDVLKCLGYKNINKTIDAFDISIDNKKFYKNIEISQKASRIYNMHKNRLFINEPGLYEILSQSTKPLAKKFMNKYYTEIMPSIRKNGTFIVL